MTCNHARCSEPATVRCRMGDGYFHYNQTIRRQTYVRYCDHHFRIVATMFTLSHVQPIDRPNGPLPARLRGRHPDLVARLTP